MKNLGAASRQRVRFIVAEIVQEFRLRGLVGICGVYAVNVGPDHQFVGVHDVRNDCAGKVGAVAAECGDAAVWSRADETSDDRDDTSVEQRDQYVVASALGLFQVGLGVAERVAGEHEFRRGDRNGGDAGALQRGGEQAGAEAFAKGREAVEELRRCSDMVMDRDFVKQVAAQRVERVRNAIMRFVVERQIAQNIVVQVEKSFSIDACALIFTLGEKLRDGK